MPWLDVSDVVLDPQLADTVVVTRRADAISTKGRSTVTPTTFSAIGVVTAKDPSKLMRRDDAQLIERAISFVTKARVQSAVTGYQPDQITYNGVVYTVDSVLPFTRYGAGFVEVLALSMYASDPPIA